MVTEGGRGGHEGCPGWAWPSLCHPSAIPVPSLCRPQLWGSAVGTGTWLFLCSGFLSSASSPHCPPFPGGTSTSSCLCRFVQVCTGLYSLYSLYRFVQVCSGLYRFVQVCTGVFRFVQVGAAEPAPVQLLLPLPCAGTSPCPQSPPGSWSCTPEPALTHKAHFNSIKEKHLSQISFPYHGRFFPVIFSAYLSNQNLEQIKGEAAAEVCAVRWLWSTSNIGQI